MDYPLRSRLSGKWNNVCYMSLSKKMSMSNLIALKMTTIFIHIMNSIRSECIWKVRYAYFAMSIVHADYKYNFKTCGQDKKVFVNQNFVLLLQIKHDGSNKIQMNWKEIHDIGRVASMLELVLFWHFIILQYLFPSMISTRTYWVFIVISNTFSALFC